jgi:hypothetical protein
MSVDLLLCGVKGIAAHEMKMQRLESDQICVVIPHCQCVSHSWLEIHLEMTKLMPLQMI